MHVFSHFAFPLYYGNFTQESSQTNIPTNHILIFVQTINKNCTNRLPFQLYDKNTQLECSKMLITFITIKINNKSRKIIKNIEQKL